MYLFIVNIYHSEEGVKISPEISIKYYTKKSNCHLIENVIFQLGDVIVAEDGRGRGGTCDDTSTSAGSRPQYPSAQCSWGAK